MPVPDRALRSYLECPNDRPADDLLRALLFDHAEPLVRRVVDRRLRGTAGVQDREDVGAEILQDLRARLRQSKASTAAHALENFRTYVVGLAHQACDAFYRVRYPNRHLLKNRVRYVLRETPQFAIWTDADGATACGWARWKGRAVAEFTGCHVMTKRSEAMESALGAIFEDGGGPVELDDVAAFLAAAWGMGKGSTPGGEGVDWRAAATLDPAVALDNQRRLEHLWDGILRLPLEQRQVLLLHLRDDRGGSALALLPASGVASIPQIAEVLEMPVQKLAEWWNRLPLGDVEIGTCLGLTREAAMQLRTAARKQLGH